MLLSSVNIGQISGFRRVKSCIIVHMDISIGKQGRVEPIVGTMSRKYDCAEFKLLNLGLDISKVVSTFHHGKKAKVSCFTPMPVLL